MPRAIERDRQQAPADDQREIENIYGNSVGVIGEIVTRKVPQNRAEFRQLFLIHQEVVGETRHSCTKLGRVREHPKEGYTGSRAPIQQHAPEPLP